MSDERLSAWNTGVADFIIFLKIFYVLLGLSILSLLSALAPLSTFEPSDSTSMLQ